MEGTHCCRSGRCSLLVYIYDTNRGYGDGGGRHYGDDGGSGAGGYGYGVGAFELLPLREVQLVSLHI